MLSEDFVMAKRNGFLDVLRGMAILIVIFAHALQIHLANPYGNTPWLCIMTFEMPLLMAISGYTFGLKIPKKENIKSEIVKKIKRLLIPYLCWEQIYYFITVFYYKEKYSFKNQVASVFNSQFWFLRILFFIFIAVYLFLPAYYGIAGKIKNDSKRKLLFIGLAAVTAAICAAVSEFVPGFDSLKSYMACFALGVFINNIIHRYHIKNSLIICAGGISLPIFAAECVVLKHTSGVLNAVTDKSMAVFGSAAAAFIAFCLYYALKKFNSKRIYNFIAFTGKSTLPIYAVHWCLLITFLPLKPLQNNVYCSAFVLAAIWTLICVCLTYILRKNKLTAMLLLGEKSTC